MSKSDIFKQIGEGASLKAELSKYKKDGTIVVIVTVNLELLEEDKDSRQKPINEGNSKLKVY